MTQSPKNRFSVTIITDTERVDNFDDYVGLDDGTEFKIRMENNRDTICDAYVYLEGEFIGSWRIREYSHIDIERPANISKKFTFLKEQQAQKYGVTKGSFTNGIIKVVFKPKKSYRYVQSISPISMSPVRHRINQRSVNNYQSTASMSSNSLSSQKRLSSNQYESGATVLGDLSDQQFYDVEPLSNSEIDSNYITEIIIRLVAKKKSTGSPKYQKIKPYSKYPPRIDNSPYIFNY